MGRQRSNASVVMGKWEYRGQWSPALAGRREVAPANRPFEVLPQIVKVISKDGRGNHLSSTQTNPSRQKFVPPQGPKYPPLSECPHLAAFLTAKDRKHLDVVANGLLNRPHEFGFEVKIEPGARTDVRTIYGEQHVTYTSWSILVERRFQAKNGKPYLSTKEVEVGSGDEKILATALYLSDKLSAPRKGLHLFKPFRPPSYVEAWLAQKLNANPKMAERAKGVDGSIYLFADKPIDFAGTRPVSLFVGDEEMPLKNWRDLMVKTCDVLDRKNRKLLQQLAFRVGDKFLSDRPDGMRTPRQHELSGLYMEMYLPPYSLVLHSQLLFKKFEYNLENIGLVWTNKGAGGDAGKESGRSHIPSADKAMDRLGKGEIALISEFEEDIAANYPNGFDFKETSRRLVEARVGKPMSEAMVQVLKASMFERSDGMWLMPRLVIGKDRRDQMIARAKELIENEGAFAMDSLYGEFEEDIQNILSGRDFKRFFNKCIAEKVDGKVRGHEGWRVCFKADTPEEEGWSIIADRVRTVLVSSGDAVSIEDILAQMPHLDREVILRVCQENIKDAVTFSMDEIQYAKLLETYYLPDDFGETLSALVNKTESSQGGASIVLFEAELEAKYGEGFRVNFGLEDDAVFKQVIAKSFAGDAHEWKKDTFISEHRRAESNVAEVFLQTHDGLFHEEDFFKFALESRGMKNRGMLILTFLRKHCVRLSKAWWISLSGFDRKVAITEEQYLQIGMVLNRCVGNNAFVPIAALSNEVYESLPRLELEGRVLEWNAYLLTSLSVLRVKNARVINDEPSPYTVTGLIVPYDVGEIRDVVEYALHCYPTGYFSDADAAFDYLKANNIRMTKTEKLVAKINEMLKVV